MNKCSNCKYLCYPEYESSYSECQIFGEETPERYATEDGCNCSKELLEQLLLSNQEALEREHEAFVEWFLKEEDKNEDNSYKIST